MPLLLLVAGLTAATIGYGGFSRPYAVALVALVSSAVIAAAMSGSLRRGLAVVPGEVGAAAAALAALGAWAFARGWWAGDVWSGLPMAALCLGGAAVLLLVGVAADDARQSLILSLLMLGAGVALIGWFGSLTHTYPLAVADQGVWRASSTMGYPNALAGLLGPLVLVAAGRLVSRGGRGGAILLALLLMGWMVSFSRGGALAMGIAVVVLLLLTPRVPMLRTIWAPVLGALVIVAGLTPGLRDGSDTAVVPAVLGLALGLVMAAAPWLPRRGPGPARGPVRAATAGGAVAGGLAVAALGWAALRHGGAAADAVQALISGKVSLNSSYRLDQHGAAFDALAGRPLTGVGPGRADLRWTEPDGSVLVARYVHDEYVQVLLETGLIGAVLLGVALGAVAVTLSRGRRSPPSATTAGVVAGVVAFAVHSGFDFLWHLPVLPLVVLCLAAAVSRRRVPAQVDAGTPVAAVSDAAPVRTPAAPPPRRPAG